MFRRNDPVHIVNTIEKTDDTLFSRMEYLNGIVIIASVKRAYVDFGENSPYPGPVWTPNKNLFAGHAPDGVPMYERKPL